MHRRRSGRIVLAVSLAVLVLLALPLVSGSLIASLEQRLPSPPEPAAAIIILSADLTEIVIPGGTAYTVGRLTLERERAGAVLARRTGLPVLVSGGLVRPGAPSLAALMASSLRNDFAIPPTWLEDRSFDTWENAARSAAILRAARISTVYVVTHAWHMRRALIAFRAAGLHAVPVPVMPTPAPELAWNNLIPRVSAWQDSYWALHEWIGCAWYALHA